MDVPTIGTYYDEGSFDKDEQGWCARNVSIAQQDRRVSVRKWGADNGNRAYDEQLEGEIALVLVEQGLITFTGALSTHVFNLVVHREEPAP